MFPALTVENHTIALLHLTLEEIEHTVGIERLVILCHLTNHRIFRIAQIDNRRRDIAALLIAACLNHHVIVQIGNHAIGGSKVDAENIFGLFFVCHFLFLLLSFFVRQTSASVFSLVSEVSRF